MHTVQARFFLLFCLLAALCSPVFALAAIPVKDAPVTREKVCNPRPDPRDLLLPMPCRLSLVLRLVEVQARPGQSQPFVMGLANASQERQIYEGPREARIAAPFAATDLPLAWRVLLRDELNSSAYLLGKYEVSRAQWQAVMGRRCPNRWPKGSDLPQTGISRAEVEVFLRKYNLWLLKYHKDRLPRFAENTHSIGFLRLPLEEEWEFAAKGGNEVASAERDSEDLFPLNGKRLEDYGVFSAAAPVHEPLPIGSRLPNPLGLHDTVGNVKELVEGRFRLSGDAGGAAGGLLCKGGNFRSTGEAGVLPGWREELAPYTEAGETRPADLGFRVALSGISTASAQHIRRTQEQATRLAAERAAAQMRVQDWQKAAQPIPAERVFEPFFFWSARERRMGKGFSLYRQGAGQGDCRERAARLYPLAEAAERQPALPPALDGKVDCHFDFFPAPCCRAECSEAGF